MWPSCFFATPSAVYFLQYYRPFRRKIRTLRKQIRSPSNITFWRNLGLRKTLGDKLFRPFFCLKSAKIRPQICPAAPLFNFLFGLVWLNMRPNIRPVGNTGNSVPNCAAPAGGLYAGVVQPHHLVHHRLRHARQTRLLPASRQTEDRRLLYYILLWRWPWNIIKMHVKIQCLIPNLGS